MSANMTLAKAEAARNAIDAAIGRKAFLPFCALAYPGFVTAPHLQLLAELLERVESGRTATSHCIAASRFRKKYSLAVIRRVVSRSRSATADISTSGFRTVNRLLKNPTK